MSKNPDMGKNKQSETKNKGFGPSLAPSDLIWVTLGQDSLYPTFFTPALVCSHFFGTLARASGKNVQQHGCPGRKMEA